MIKRFTVYILATLVLTVTLANAGTPEAGDMFMGGSKVEYPDRGVTFTLPTTAVGFASKYAPDHELFVGVKPHESDGVSSLIIQVGTAKFDAIVHDMSHKVIFNGAELYPVGNPTVLKGGVVYNDFKLTSNGQLLKAFMMALIAKNGTTIMLTTISRSQALSTYKKAMFDIAKTVNVSVGNDTSRQTKQPSHAQRSNGSQAREVIGAWMRRSNRSSSGIYIESTSKWVFSANGTVAWGSGAVVAGGTDGVSLRGGGDNPPDYGRWSTKGDTLKIHWNDGSNGTWTFSTFDYYGTPILVLTTQDGTVYRYKKID